MRFIGGTRSLQLMLTLVVVGAFTSSASAECSETRVKRMAKQGKTVASIATSCSMSKEDVQAIVEDIGTGNEGLPPGTPVGQCGCWGFVNPGMRQAQPDCQSGYAEARACNVMCPGGGFAWRGVCTK
jgi:hypothetical protein